jgi:hypothetical protein
VNVTIEDRTLDRAMRDAEIMAHEIHKVDQMPVSIMDTIVLYDEIIRLRSELEKAKSWESVAKRFHDTATEENP